jgi:hypothetical protein
LLSPFLLALSNLCTKVQTYKQKEKTMNTQHLSVQHDYVRRIMQHCDGLLVSPDSEITENELGKVYRHLANLFTVLATDTESEVQS